MKLTLIVEGQGLDLDPLADLLESATVEKERLLSDWIDMPDEMLPSKVQKEIREAEIVELQPLVNSITGVSYNPNHAEITNYIRHKLMTFHMCPSNLVGMTISANKIELILEINYG